jgi:translation initiation factor eIF-2B subunit delta
MERAERVAEARPSMAPVLNLVGRWRDDLGSVLDASPEAARTAAAEHAQSLIEASRTAAQDAAGHLASHLGAGRTLITHSLSSTVMAALERLAPLGVEVVVSESRPLNEGWRCAERLGAMGVPTTLITDAQMGLLVARADAAVVGADSLLSDGALVNKAGTWLLALAARARGVPFYVCCESFKRRPAGMPEPALERMDPGELGVPPMDGVRVENRYFDVTPAALISAWFDERGMERGAGG